MPRTESTAFTVGDMPLSKVCRHASPVSAFVNAVDAVRGKRAVFFAREGKFTGRVNSDLHAAGGECVAWAHGRSFTHETIRGADSDVFGVSPHADAAGAFCAGQASEPSAEFAAAESPAREDVCGSSSDAALEDGWEFERGGAGGAG